MRLAEGKIPEAFRIFDAFCVRVRPSVGRRRAACAAGRLASALIISASAWAQDADVLPVEIKERIETTFALVLGNSAELAVPLTRRALARRSIEDDSEANIDALAYQEATPPDDQPEHTATIAPSGSALEPAAEEPGVGQIEQGSAEDEEDPDVARLPRPRPPAPGEEPTIEEATAEEVTAEEVMAEGAMGGPLDLVAGAAVEVAATEVAVEAATGDPQPLLSAHPSPTGLASEGANAPPVAEIIASGACLAPGDVKDKDGDFSRNAAVLSGNGFCIAEETFKERRRTWTIATIKTSRPGPLFAVMHDDEDLSFDTAVEALKTYGGTLVAVETGGRRNMDGIDPNRNFSADGIGCKKLGKDAAPKYSEFFQNLFDPGQPIIALHNNTGERISTGGLGHVSMADVPKSMQVHESNDPNGLLAGERALVLMTSIVPVTTTAEARAADLSTKGINAVVEGVREEKGDCSLSNYSLLSGHPDYLNVTVDKGERDKQRKIIDVILSGQTEEVATQ